MKGVDLNLFQFDWDQTWCVFFLNADGTIYGRYGSRAGSGDKSTTHISIVSFQKSMERALELHRGYPANKSQLAGKRGPKFEYATAEKIPNVEEHHCIHCHNVREGILRTKWLDKKLTAADLWTHPLPENIGLTMDVDDGLRVESVTPESFADKAGIRAGDVLVSLAGQTLISQADVQWVLHRSPVEAKLGVLFFRGGKERAATVATLTLSGSWKESDIAWRSSSGPGLRYGFWPVPLAASDKSQRGIPAGSLAFRVKNLYAPRAGKLKEAGMREGDIIIAVDGKTDAMTESQFISYLRLAHPPGDTIRFTLLRQGKREELEVPTW
jgi:hypothetical protein